MRLQSHAPDFLSSRDEWLRNRAAARTVRSAFPSVARIHIHLSFEERGGGSPAAQSHELHPPARAFFAYPCPHGDCDGTFDVSAAAHLAVEHASLRSVGRLECTGLRPKGFGAKGPCGLRLAYTIAVVREAGPAR